MRKTTVGGIWEEKKRWKDTGGSGVSRRFRSNRMIASYGRQRFATDVFVAKDWNRPPVGDVHQKGDWGVREIGDHYRQAQTCTGNRLSAIGHNPNGRVMSHATIESKTTGFSFFSLAYQILAQARRSCVDCSAWSSSNVHWSTLLAHSMLIC